MTGLMQGMRVLITGLAKDKSLPWEFASKLSEHGAELTFSNPNAAIEKPMRSLAPELDSDFVFLWDVGEMASIDVGLRHLGRTLDDDRLSGPRDGASDKNNLCGRYSDISLENFLNSMSVSVLQTDRGRQARAGGNAERRPDRRADLLQRREIVPHYNVMGVAKSALERYLAADLRQCAGQRNFDEADPHPRRLQHRQLQPDPGIDELNEPLGRNVMIEDVCGAAL